MRYIIDRFEDGLAVLEKEDGALEHIPMQELPEDVREGSVLLCENGAWILDPQAEAERRARLFERQEGLFG